MVVVKQTKENVSLKHNSVCMEFLLHEVNCAKVETCMRCMDHARTYELMHGLYHFDISAITNVTWKKSCRRSSEVSLTFYCAVAGTVD